MEAGLAGTAAPEPAQGGHEFLKEPERKAAMLRITETPEGIIFTVRVAPRSSRSGIAGIRGECLAIRTTAPPVEGRANEAFPGILAEFLRVPRSSIAILGGSKMRNKRVFVAGITRNHMESLVQEYERSRSTANAER